MRTLKDWHIWLEGLMGAVIGGTANAVAAMITDLAVFNLDTELPKLCKFVLVSGLLSASLYLRQRPLPKDSHLKNKASIKEP